MATSLKKFRNSELIKDYWSENGERCEVSGYLTDEDRAEVAKIRKTSDDYGLQLHHILGEKRYKVDNWSNVIIINHIVHMLWGHLKNHTALTIVCLYAKFRKGQFDIHELNTAGAMPIRGSIQKKKFKLKHRPEYVDMCEQMLATIPEL